MGNDWPIHELSEYIRIKHGYAFKGEFFSDVETTDCLITPGNFAVGGGFKGDKLKYYAGPVPEDYILKKDDLVVTMTDLSKQADTLGYSALVPELEAQRLLHNQRVGLIEFKDSGLDKYFLYFLLRSANYRHHIIGSATGTTVKHTAPSKITSYRFRKPPLSEQKRMAKVLLAFEHKIELNRQANQTLESMAQALFKSWFVDFDPVIDNALTAGNDIPEPLAAKAATRRALKEQGTNNANQPHVLPNDIRQLFPNRFQFTEELGWIPEGWDSTSVDKAIYVNPRVSLKKGGIAKYVDMKALPTRGYGVDGIIQKAYSGGAKFEKGDVLLARITPCLENGKTGIVDFLEEGEVGFGSTEFIVLRPKGDLTMPFVASLARDNDFRSHCIQSMVGSSGRQRVQNSSFSDYFLALPADSEVLRMFNKIVKTPFERMTTNNNENSTVTAVRDTLFPKLLSGELRIPEAEKMLDEALA